MAGLYDLSATALIDGFRNKTFSPSEVLDDVLGRIALWEPHINALYDFRPEEAKAMARASDARWQKGEPIGRLDGVPITIKENVATKGVPIPLGTAVTPLVPAPVDAPPAARVREAGAVFVSKTTMPDFGMLSSGLSSFHGITRNPWDLSQNTGGSSAGAGAAGAAGYGPLHIGTDIGGSVRLPACWCGIFALKPSLGRIPIDPPYVGRVTGPMTRTVEDAALMMSVLSQPDARDSMSLPPADIPWMALDGDVKGLKIGLQLDASYGLPVDDDVRRVVIEAARAFEAAGAIVTEVGSTVTRELHDGIDTFWRARMWDEVSKLPPSEQAKILPFILKWAEGGAGVSGVEAVRGFNATMAIRANAAKLFQQVDYVISPVAPNVSYPADLAAPTDDPSLPLDHIGFTLPWNMAENPAASVPGGFSANGFPIGVQIAGRRFDDLGVLRMAKAFEAMRPPLRAWPEPPAA